MRKILLIISVLWASAAYGQSRILMEAGQRKALADTTSSDQQTGSFTGWGDSMTAGFGLGNVADSNWVNVLRVISGYYGVNQGVSGETSTQVKARFLSNRSLWGLNTVIWVGRNNITDSATIINDIRQMIDSLGHDRYIVMTVLNRTDETNGTSGFNSVIKVNNGIFSNFIGHVFDIRRFIINSYNPSLPSDVAAYNDSVPPPSLMSSDPIHMNGIGYRLTAQRIYSTYLSLFTGDKVMSEAAFRQFFKAPRLNTDNDSTLLGSKFNVRGGNIGIGSTTFPRSLSIGNHLGNKGITIFNTTDETTNFERIDLQYIGSFFSIGSNAGGTGTVRPIRLGVTGGINIDIGAVVSGLQKGSSAFNATLFGGNSSIGGVYGDLGSFQNNNGFAIVPTINKVDGAVPGSAQMLWISPYKQSTSGPLGKNMIRAGWNSAVRGTGTDTAYFILDSTGNILTNGGSFFGAERVVGMTANPVKKTNAIVQMNSLTQGFIIPRMTAAQRLAISVSSGDSSLRVYDLDSIRTMEYSGSGWRGIRYTDESAISSSGDYTPTVTNVANLISSSGETATYYRMGDKVHIDGSFSVSLTALVSTTINISMPFASNFTTITDAKGVCNFVATTSNGATVTADSTNDLITLNFTAVNTSGVVNFSLSYTVK